MLSRSGLKLLSPDVHDPEEPEDNRPVLARLSFSAAAISNTGEETNGWLKSASSFWERFRRRGMSLNDGDISSGGCCFSSVASGEAGGVGVAGPLPPLLSSSVMLMGTLSRRAARSAFSIIEKDDGRGVSMGCTLLAMSQQWLKASVRVAEMDGVGVMKQGSDGSAEKEKR